MKTVYLAGGCFWGAEKYLSLLSGVLSTTVGYANGHTQNPVYEEVCAGNTGHAETVRVLFDETVLPLTSLLNLFFEMIDPVSVNRQGEDTGDQYRTGIYYADEADRPTVQDALCRLQAETTGRVAVECQPLHFFCEAEEYHQQYLLKHPDGYCHVPADRFDRARQYTEGR